ncbi:hypothetical protein [Brevibacillus dissolubilis]|uniref:hypothetical protein n=1 Tax=Brevibacillus dissolubilis TaxID=1844116 RepID=UPI001116DC68|nr:hypothetical protein [Brevibacillus dissolubilis]
MVQNRKWRNPYASIVKKSKPAQATQAPKASVALTPQAAQKRPPATSRLVPVDLRSSVSWVRNNLKGIGSTIRQMEETMDTLHGAMQMIESLGVGRPSLKAAKSTGRGPVTDELLDDDQDDDTANRVGNLLNNIDLNQLMSLLQSPLVQNLLNQNLGASTNNSTRKKEG